MDDNLGTSQHDSVQQTRMTLLETAVRYAEERHWDVCPGAWIREEEGKEPRCSCDAPSCARPGAHPLEDDWEGQASGNAAVVRRMWEEFPQAAIVLPTGRAFDVIDVPEVAGCLALARLDRMGVELGPVAGTPDRRLLFFVLPGAAAKVPEMLRGMGWAPSSLDLITRGEGDYILAPPSKVGTAGAMLWARPPTQLNRWLPETEQLLGALAYACAREGRITSSKR